MEHFIGLANENEFIQFKKLTGLSDAFKNCLVFDGGKVWLRLQPTSPTFTILTLARIRGQLQGFQVAWRHCEALLNDMLNAV